MWTLWRLAFWLQGVLALACAARPYPASGSRPSHAAPAHTVYPEPTKSNVHKSAFEAHLASGTAATTPTPAPPAPVPTPQLVELETEGHYGLLVSPERRVDLPLVVVAHGAGGNPAWHCDFWSQVLPERYILCIRGRKMGPGAYYYENHFKLEERLLALVDYVHAEYASKLSSLANVYIGYSQGATMGALLMPKHAAAFPNVLLLEGGYAEWPLFSAKRFAANGGHRVFFACGTRSCQRGAERSKQHLSKMGIAARSAYAEGAGHTPAGAVGELAAEGFRWLQDTTSNVHP